MGFALLGKLLGIALLSVMGLSLCQEAQAMAVWKVVDLAERQQYLNCTRNRTSQDAQFRGALMRFIRRCRRLLKDDPELQLNYLNCPAKQYEVFRAFQSRECPCVAWAKLAGHVIWKLVREPPRVFANPKSERALEGGDVILVCESFFYPPIDYWGCYCRDEQQGDARLFNGTQQRVFIIENPHRSELLHRRLDAAQDSGQYICLGLHAATVLLHVRIQLAAFCLFLAIMYETLLHFVIVLLKEHSRFLAEELGDMDQE